MPAKKLRQWLIGQREALHSRKQSDEQKGLEHHDMEMTAGRRCDGWTVED